MLQAALLWYSKFREDLESKGFKFNPYDPCAANWMMGDKQHTIVFHVDDLKSSHEDKTVNDKFERWLQDKYGNTGRSRRIVARNTTTWEWYSTTAREEKSLWT